MKKGRKIHGGHVSSGSLPVDFSVVVPCFNEAASICEFHERLVTTLLQTQWRYEIVYVNDASEDETLDRLLEIHADKRIPNSIVDLVQNVGQTNALTAGVACAAGRHVIFLDSDLQVAPEDLPRLLEVFDDSHDMVSGKRIERKDNLFRVHFSRLGNAFIRRTLGLPLYDFGSGMKILNGAFVRAFEPGPFRPINPGAMMLSLRRVKEAPISHHVRASGGTRWTARRFFALYHNIFRHLIPFIYPFTVAPLLILSLLLLAFLALNYLYPEVFPYDSETPLTAILVTFNIALSLVNFLLLGEFVLRGSNQAQEPAYIIRRVFAGEADNAPRG